ncbi:hypothetical protein AXL65_02540 [Salmonella enterica subsp. enterica]|nr:hypothetical protein [Salmonella enterica subsp. enterica]
MNFMNAIGNLFKTKEQKAIEQADRLAAYFFHKGLTPINLGTSLERDMTISFKDMCNADLTADQFISFCMVQTIKEKAIEVRHGKFRVVVDITGMRDQLHLKQDDSFDDAILKAAEFISISPRIIHALKITQHPMPGRINMECYHGDEMIYTVMLCPEIEG